MIIVTVLLLFCGLNFYLVAVDEIDQEALKKRKRMRMNFTPEEDSLVRLLLCVLVLD